MGPTWGPPGSCRPQMGPMLIPWTLLSGQRCQFTTIIYIIPTITIWESLCHGIWFLYWNRAQYSNSFQRWCLFSIGNPIVQMRQSYDHFISTVGFPILVKMTSLYWIRVLMVIWLTVLWISPNSWVARWTTDDGKLGCQNHFLVAQIILFNQFMFPLFES